MARIVSQLVGQGSGKVGTNVLYHANGKQFQRALAATVKNPRTAKQSVQRAILATAAKLTAGLRPYINHSIEGMAPGEISVREFQRNTLNALRAAAASAVNGDENPTPAAFSLKGSQFIGGCEGLRVSRGSLMMAGCSMNEDGDVIIGNNVPSTAITTQAEYEAALAAFGLVPGDQLSVLTIIHDSTVASASYGIVRQGQSFPIVCRVTFKAALPDDFSGNLITSNTFNSALVESAEGLANFEFSIVEGKLKVGSTITDEDVVVFAAAVVRSQKQENGTFKYNTARLMINTTGNNILFVYGSYMTSGESIEVGDQLFLQNAVEEEPAPAQIRGIRRDFSFPISITELEGKHITLLGGVLTSDLVFATETPGETLTISGGYLTDGSDHYNPVSIEGNVITFGELAASTGPVLTGCTF